MNRKHQGDYSDIIYLPHPTSKKHPRMSIHARAAQFAPFAALTGHGEAIRETERLTAEKVCLAPDQMEYIDEKLRDIAGMLSCGQHPFVTVTHFVPDDRKDGGAYREKTGHVIKIDKVKQTIWFEGSEMVPVRNIRDILVDRL